MIGSIVMMSVFVSLSVRISARIS